ncbi:MAG: nickel pincer cofactor biosynthesis protein LarC [Spirochaetaceae bacterium]|jgi:uncharacterized protein (TIGR00299 family) protein|nr:nickel pincer cofactor biosynthesis protein LarC [Spirochaetaceae bacterium]
MKILHFDCFAGISGDMALGAFVDLGVAPEYILGELKKLNVHGWKLDFTKAHRCGIYGTEASVVLDEKPPAGHAGHTSWSEIKSLIEASALTEGAKRRAIDIFAGIAAAEAEVHGTTPEEVCFHEVGALDSIIDIAGAAICLDVLQPDKITAGPVELGGGFVECAHGTLPVPAPAVLRLCASMPVTTGGFDKEMTTPTGAGILAAIVDEFIHTTSFIQVKTGFGIGKRVLDKPNILRVSWREAQTAFGAAADAEGAAAATGTGEPAEAARGVPVYQKLRVLETNIDDMTGEELSFLMDNLFDAGALDVTATPCCMKKNRPAQTVSVLCDRESADAIVDCLFAKSSTLGIKIFDIARAALPRRIEKLHTEFGPVNVKTAWYNGQQRRKIEYDDRAAAARLQNISLRQSEYILNEYIEKKDT